MANALPEPSHPAPAADTGTPGISSARLQAFSDAVIAIAATLLVLEIKLPEHEGVWAGLRHELPALASYAVSFLVIGIVWIHHHNLFHRVRQVDRALLLLNLGLLLTVSFLPVPTATLGSRLDGADATAAAVFYSLAVGLTSVWFLLFWHHLCRRPHLLVPGALAEARLARRHAVTGPVVYFAAAALALVTPVGSLGLNAALIGYLIVNRRSPTARTRPGAAAGAAPDRS